MWQWLLGQELCGVINSFQDLRTMGYSYNLQLLEENCGRQICLLAVIGRCVCPLHITRKHTVDVGRWQSICFSYFCQQACDMQFEAWGLVWKTPTFENRPLWHTLARRVVLGSISPGSIGLEQESAQACMAWLLPIAAVPADKISVAAGWVVTYTNTHRTLAEERGNIVVTNSQQKWGAIYSWWTVS